MALNWLNVDGKMAESHWGIERSEAPEPDRLRADAADGQRADDGPGDAVFSQREFHVKNAEGN